MKDDAARSRILRRADRIVHFPSDYLLMFDELASVPNAMSGRRLRSDYGVVLPQADALLSQMAFDPMLRDVPARLPATVQYFGALTRP